jgi:predicted amidohydrolase
VLYFSPGGALAGRHRKLVPTGSERTVWGMGDGSTLRVVDTPFGRVGRLICWENYMPLARFHMYAQGVDLWIAPTLAIGDGWIASLQHLARENRMFVVGVNPVLHADQIPATFPHRERLGDQVRELPCLAPVDVHVAVDAAVQPEEPQPGWADRAALFDGLIQRAQSGPATTERS